MTQPIHFSAEMGVRSADTVLTTHGVCDENNLDDDGWAMDMTQTMAHLLKHLHELEDWRPIEVRV